MTSIPELQERWDEEAVEQTLAGNPQRAWYIHWMATRVPQTVERMHLRAVAEQRTWPPPNRHQVQAAQAQLRSGAYLPDV